MDKTEALKISNAALKAYEELTDARNHCQAMSRTATLNTPELARFDAACVNWDNAQRAVKAAKAEYPHLFAPFAGKF